MSPKKRVMMAADQERAKGLKQPLGFQRGSLNTCCVMEHSAAAGVCQLDIGSGCQQGLDAGDAVEADRDAKRCDAAAVLLVDVCALLNQPLQRRLVANLGSIMQRAGQAL